MMWTLGATAVAVQGVVCQDPREREQGRKVKPDHGGESKRPARRERKTRKEGESKGDREARPGSRERKTSEREGKEDEQAEGQTLGRVGRA